MDPFYISSVALKRNLAATITEHILWLFLSSPWYRFPKGEIIKVLCCVLSLTLDTNCFPNKACLLRHFSKSGCLLHPAHCHAEFSRGVQSFSVLLREELCIQLSVLQVRLKLS